MEPDRTYEASFYSKDMSVHQIELKDALSNEDITIDGREFYLASVTFNQFRVWYDFYEKGIPNV